MSTKQQERDALAKIQKICDGLGENSYVATAFIGAFQLAEQNIEDDAAYSALYYIDAYNGHTCEMDTLLRQQQEKEREHKEELCKAEAAKTVLEEDIARLHDASDEILVRARTAEAKLADTRMELAAAQRSILALKAAIYDLEHGEGVA